MQMPILFFMLVLISVPVTASDDRLPEGLSDSDWSSIRGAYEANRHAAVAVEGGYLMRNPGQQWRTWFDGRGFLTTPDAGGWAWGLKLVSYGRVGAEREVGVPTCVEADGGRVSYQWGEGLTEWYVNDARGLEHGYTVLQEAEASGNHQVTSGPITNSEPNSPSATEVRRNKPLRFTLLVRGGLVPHVSSDGCGVMFIGSNGAAVVNYGGLKVLDANGAEVPTWFESTNDELQLSVDDRLARYPLAIDPIAQQAYLKASNTGMSDWYGFSVAVSNDTVVVGAYLEDSGATGVNGNQGNDNNAANSGAAYVFVRSGGIWTQQAYLKASNTGIVDYFGQSVAVSGDTVVVGAYKEGSNATGVNGNQANDNAPGSGAVYVFVRNGTTWSQQAYLKASNTGASDFFGYSVAASGDTVVVGAYQEDSNATSVNGNQSDNSAADSGAAYIFVRSGGVWSQQAYLKASNTGAFDHFGESVAMSGDTVVVGAYQEDSNATGVNGNQADDNAFDSGAVYVFVRNGTIWSQQAYLKASNTAVNDNFGSSVAVSSETAVVGAWAEDSNAIGINGNQADNSASNSGAVYVFVRSGDAWSQQAYLKASNTGANDRFYSVAVSGNVVLVGAWGEDSSAVGVNGNQANDHFTESGAAYVFARCSGMWCQQAYLKSSNTSGSDWFGTSVAVSGDTAVVGAMGEDSNAMGMNGNQADNSATDAGAVYIFNGVGCPVWGNMNCDCVVDVGDIEPFVQALIDPAGYSAAFLGCSVLNADMQTDGVVNGSDVQGFVGMLIP